MLKETPSQTAGPYLHIGMMPAAAGLEGRKGDDQLNTLAGPGAKGERIRLEGTVFDGEGSDIIVEAVTDDAPPEDRALVGRFTGISFAVDDLDRAYQELTAAGFAFSGAPELQPWGGRLATVTDPSGNKLQLVQYP